MVTFIDAVEVAPDADAPFVAGWERVRGLLAAADAGASTALHRALRADVTLRYVAVAHIASEAVWQDAVDGADLPGAVHAAAYEVVHEDGQPEGGGGVVLIEPSEVPAGEDERFRMSWERVRALFAVRQGYLGTRLHRSLGPADFRFVTFVRWSSPLMFARTLQQPEVAQALAAVPFPGRRALYLPIAG